MTTNYTKSEQAILKTIGANVHRLRKAKGFTQETLAFECGLDRTYIGGIERGERNLAVLNIVRLCNVLKVPPHKIFAQVVK